MQGDAVPFSGHEMVSNPAAPDSGELESQTAGFEAFSHSASSTMFNKVFLRREMIMLGAMLPLGMYTIAAIGTPAFHPNYPVTSQYNVHRITVEYYLLGRERVCNLRVETAALVSHQKTEIAGNDRTSSTSRSFFLRALCRFRGSDASKRPG